MKCAPRIGPTQGRRYGLATSSAYPRARREIASWAEMASSRSWTTTMLRVKLQYRWASPDGVRPTVTLPERIIDSEEAVP